MERTRVLVVDDEKTIQHVLTTLLRQQGYETESAGSAEEALTKLERGPISVAFLDIVLPGMNGLNLLDRIKERDPDVEIIVMTSQSSAKTAIDALRKGAYDYIDKPFELDHVIAVAERAASRRHLRLDNRRLQEEQGRQNKALEEAFDNLRRAQDDLVATGRLKAIGEMAAGVAHDFNNLLNGVLANSQLIQRDLGEDRVSRDRVRKRASLVEKLALQGADTVRRLQDFAGIRKDRPTERVDLNDVARRAVELTTPKWQGELGVSGISIEVEVLLPSVPAITGNVRELTQAVSNLIFNAVEAMPTGGLIRIVTSEDDKGVRLTVSDTGCGMSQEVQERLFESFFTTKAQGQGLGMSVVQGIIRRLGGEIEIESRPGEGTSISLVFPPASEVAIAGEPARPVDSDIPTERGRILVVDDDEINREICGEVLEPLGHEIHRASSGSEAVEMIARDRFDLVITDLSMPGASGWDVARQVKERSPSTRVMILSGWGVQQDPEQTKALGIDLVLSKPVQVHELAQAVQRLLSGPRLSPQPVGRKSSQDP